MTSEVIAVKNRRKKSPETTKTQEVSKPAKVLPEPSDQEELELTTELESDDITLTFEDLGLSEALLKAVDASGYKKPSPIQEKAIPLILSGIDIIGQAHTGSGKTAAFALPTLERLENLDSVEILVLTPTRELAAQIVNEYTRLGQFCPVGKGRSKMGAKAIAVVGGHSSFKQIDSINFDAKVVVATPGRLLDHLGSGKLSRFKPHMIVLDEADEMLDMGFIDDIRQIFSFLPEKRQVMMFSATMPPMIRRLSNELLKDPVVVDIRTNLIDVPKIDKFLVILRPLEKRQALARIIDAEIPEKCIVFCRTRLDADEISQFLHLQGYVGRALHGDMTQNARNEVISGFKQGRYRILIATDVASRGLDISDVSHVFNFHLPDNKERFTHRIGRTGRAGKTGRAYTFATTSELKTSGFFRSMPIKEFTFTDIPSRQIVETSRYQNLWTEISEFAVHDSVNELAIQLGIDVTDQEKLKLLAFALSGVKVKGPEVIGLSSDEVKSMMKRGPQRPFDRSSGPSRSRFSQPRSYGRGGSGSSGGSREGGRDGAREGSRDSGRYGHSSRN